MTNLTIIVAYMAGTASGFSFAHGWNGIGATVSAAGAIACGLLYSYAIPH